MKKKKKKNKTYLGDNFWSVDARKGLWVTCRHSLTPDNNNIENKKILQNFGPGFFFFSNNNRGQYYFFFTKL